MQRPEPTTVAEVLSTSGPITMSLASGERTMIESGDRVIYCGDAISSPFIPGREYEYSHSTVDRAVFADVDGDSRAKPLRAEVELMLRNRCFRLGSAEKEPISPDDLTIVWEGDGHKFHEEKDCARDSGKQPSPSPLDDVIERGDKGPCRRCVGERLRAGYDRLR